MLSVTTPHALDNALAAWRQQDQSIALVPTMGNLHAGHLALIQHARRVAERVVVSVFVNPLQFDRAEDLAAYPRTLDADRALLETHQVDVLFAPSAQLIYPRPLHDISTVIVPTLSEILEGEHRKGHFAGVATVVCKLFNLVRPQCAVFGEKDFQQLLLIQRMVEDLNIPVNIIAHPTLRESDGLAMSSRNSYLTPQQRAQAPALYRTLQQLRTALLSSAEPIALHEARALKDLQAAGFLPEYLTVRRRHDLALPTPADRQRVILASAWLGKARLIDNCPLDLPHGP
ncbi:pantoate--beta-alanine ligase [Thiorhodospira sibirica]|uniref:pantoate--beta-alanine ligase n=1 Tax=Thiorhodospira sibirica TaxID=154347 RepID=UPI00022C170C|nr:pantoate--beta-alanine ligase [Thiorhodospira sibirica]